VLDALVFLFLWHLLRHFQRLMDRNYLFAPFKIYQLFVHSWTRNLRQDPGQF
jgi:hypothetical protein